jgi:hypothetical protein
MLSPLHTLVRFLLACLSLESEAVLYLVGFVYTCVGKNVTPSSDKEFEEYEC